MDMAELLAWAPYVIGGAVLMSFPMGRRILKWTVLLPAMVIIALLAFSEPDLRG